jgi:hypothetical protein
MDYLAELKRLLPLNNRQQDGVDSTKRKLAIEAIAGPADGRQTDRLVTVVIAMLEARSPNTTKSKLWPVGAAEDPD